MDEEFEIPLSNEKAYLGKRPRIDCHDKDTFSVDIRKPQSMAEEKTAKRKHAEVGTPFLNEENICNGSDFESPKECKIEPNDNDINNCQSSSQFCFGETSPLDVTYEKLLLPSLCPHCGISVKHRFRNTHIKSHIIERYGVSECNICNSKFYKKAHAKRHLTYVHKSEIYKNISARIKAAEMSLKHDEDREELAENQDVDDFPAAPSTEITYEDLQLKSMCPHCGLTVNKKFRKNHIKSHIERFPTFLKCNICDMKFPNRIQGASHLVRAHKAEVLTCFTCGQIFHSRNALQKHFSDAHLHNEPKECDEVFVICQNCKVLEKEENFRDHVCRRYSSGQMMCEHCRIAFEDEDSMYEHDCPQKDNIYLEQLTLRCGDCEGIFDSEETFQEHLCHPVEANSSQDGL